MKLGLSLVVDGVGVGKEKVGPLSPRLCLGAHITFATSHWQELDLTEQKARKCSAAGGLGAHLQSSHPGGEQQRNR